MHRDQCHELQYFRIKKRKMDDHLEELEDEVAKLRAKRKRVVARLDEIEQTARVWRFVQRIGRRLAFSWCGLCQIVF